ncbi:MAG: hypothetical protein LBT45_00660 [Rickettsiales bacterium]|jgi:lipid-A-disaccharide synthase|nr:hypothetical protein [Rickettsiales bacterium]
MTRGKKVFIIAGEVSGDVLGGELMRVALEKNPDMRFVGIGGDMMAAAGLKTLFSISDLSVMGVGEVMRKSRTLLERIRRAAAAIASEKPDVVLTVDSPSFASRVIKRARRAGARTKFYHVVAPMVWAWGARRAKKYAKIFDRLFCFFDFEKSYFEKYGLDTEVIGYPIYGIVRREMRNADKKYIALLPGSRMGEVSKVLPIYAAVTARRPEYDYAIPVTETTRDFIGRETKSWRVKPRLIPFAKRYDLYNETRFAVSVIGTATAELAIMRVPAVVVWRPSWLTAVVSRFVLKIKWKSLVNILAGKKIYPELNGREVTAENIIAEAERVDSEKIISELENVDHLWHRGDKSPMRIVADALVAN